jgi:hypothetical protein
VVGEDTGQLVLVTGLKQISTVPSGSAANASSVGANTVKGPSLLSVSTRPAASAAASKVLNDPAAAAVSTMSSYFAVGPEVAQADSVNIAIAARAALALKIFIVESCV